MWRFSASSAPLPSRRQWLWHHVPNEKTRVRFLVPPSHYWLGMSWNSPCCDLAVIGFGWSSGVAFVWPASRGDLRGWLRLALPVPTSLRMDDRNPPVIQTNKPSLVRHHWKSISQHIELMKDKVTWIAWCQKRRVLKRVLKSQHSTLTVAMRLLVCLPQSKRCIAHQARFLHLLDAAT